LIKGRQVFVLLAVLAVFLMDNAIWFGRFIPAFPGDGAGIWLTRSEKEVLGRLDAAYLRGRTVLSQNALVGYLCTVYTPLRHWASHPLKPPAFRLHRKELDDLFASGLLLESWRSMPLAVVCSAGQSPGCESLLHLGATQVFSNRDFVILQWN